METDKRKRLSDGGEADLDGKRAKSQESNAVKAVVPADEEVDEFFAILRRIKVAVQYFQRRNRGGDLTAAPWSPSFEGEDFDGVEKDPEKREEDQIAGLDLNSDPISDEPDGSDSI